MHLKADVHPLVRLEWHRGPKGNMEIPLHLQRVKGILPDLDDGDQQETEMSVDSTMSTLPPQSNVTLL